MMVDPKVAQLATEKEIPIACAYNFPAVLQTVGVKHWGTLKKVFFKMLKMSPRIRHPLACSIHEIAKIIGSDLT